MICTLLVVSPGVSRIRLHNEESLTLMDTADPAVANALNRCMAEEAAVMIRCYSGPNLPELLLTPAWAQRIREFRFRHRSATARMDAELLSRRQVVVGGTSAVRVILVTGEESLRRLEAEKMEPRAAASQLRRLRKHASEQQVRFLIHPFTAPLHPESADRFTITSDPAGRSFVFVESMDPGGLLILRESWQVALYLRIFDELSRDSLTEDRSLLRIDDALQRVRDLTGAAERGLACGG
ncbi:Scr1 family TA system antitoxin-like transcriptional regulator [Amycolatopsis japonica]|uniref:Scr1 family TA system antitoxin-like transcriptional regulator n=1 Tax=Amycolatopsis japonica TaxID=208439 RepID=UPI00366ECA4D